MKHIALVICVGGILISCGAKQPNDSKSQTDVRKDTVAVIKRPKVSTEEFNRIYSLSDNFYSSLERSGFNGSFLVAKDDSIIYERYRGFENLRTKTPPVGEHSAFHLASVSKTFTAMAVLKLMEEKKIVLDSSVQYYLPAFPYPGITVKMLLNHRSGLPNYLYWVATTNWDKHTYLTNDSLLALLARLKPKVMTRPNTHFHYCNTNYAMLALIVEKVTGMPFPQYMKQTIFDPLGMTDTHIVTSADLQDVMPSYMGNGRIVPWSYLDGTYGDKNVYSTTHDLLKWDQALRTDFLTKASLDMAYAPYSFEKPGIRNYGLGWHLFLYPTEKVIFHNGYWHGNNTVFFRLIKEGYTIIVLGNRYDRYIYHVQPLAESLTGRKFNAKGAPEPDSEDSGDTGDGGGR
ncbi:serine hydrolase domain-containing protein [Dinghuibacter silviterrae]|uniref:CubicO group peptidase (Beta-lactamase class C family) n=1 Tax=Dinghuibacter silviterrae TaxID=1539049 RepID=A0A4R8DWH7_9BACT|nr:serine hydrolase domain-containing protein [Dinghuibacter silviterrae]TDX02298.1 CubicO group peptidase (beta-lactamase class C family) [Dinghuibacter silviterrae]